MVDDEEEEYIEVDEISLVKNEPQDCSGTKSSKLLIK